ncbi:MAG TPA: hypothetical protein PKD24_10380 [Pyrinomonadaceae bacterium]|nr:hypothetical protein [Pyrinomonadaceae bacterium]HMP65588.1 hypothetical protein [Pyrinomonadaceae bacterium]
MSITNVITPATKKKGCKPFLLKVMVFTPESGYKFDIHVQLICGDENEKTWKIIFNLHKKIDDEFVHLVGIEFQTGNAEEDAAVEKISTDGISIAQNRIFGSDVYESVKPLEDGHEPSDAELQVIDGNIRSAVLA